MCLIVLGWQADERHGLRVAANRDEFHARRAAPASFWRDQPGILAGRDLQAMGTWMGVSRTGRFAAVTNYRGAGEPAAEESRGALVSRFLANGASAAGYITEVSERASRYSGFNVLVCDRDELWWMSNRDASPRRLEPGWYALGNLLLDSPDVQPIKQRIAQTPPSVEASFSALSAAKLIDPRYGTRCSTVLLDAGDTVRYAERAFAADGADAETVHFQFSAQG